MNELHPGGVLGPQVMVGLQQGPVLQDVLRRDPASGQPALGQQRPQVPGVGLVGLGVPLAAPQRGGVSRLGQVRLQAGSRQLLRDIPPPGASLDCERGLAPAGEPGQPGPHVLPVRRGDLTALDLPSRGVEIVEGDLLPVDIQPAYDRHRDLLTLPKAPQAPAREIGYTANREASELGRSPRKSPSGKAIACRLKALTGPGADAWHLMCVAGRPGVWRPGTRGTGCSGAGRWVVRWARCRWLPCCPAAGSGPRPLDPAGALSPPAYASVMASAQRSPSPLR